MIRMLLFHIHAPFLVISLQLWDLSVCCFLPFLMLKELYFGIIYFSLELCLDSCVNLLLPFPCLYLLNESLSMGSKSVVRESLYDMAPATSPPSVLPTLTSHSLPHMICSHFLAQSLFPFPPLLCKCCCFFLEYQQSSSPLLPSNNHSPSGGESAQVSTLLINILWFRWVSAWSCYHSTLSFPLS